MAFAMFTGAEIVESYYKRTDPRQAVSHKPGNRATILGAAGLLALAVLTAAIGQPSAEDRWKRIASDGDRQLRDRDVFVHPPEVVDLKKNAALFVSVLDLRDELTTTSFILPARSAFPCLPAGTGGDQAAPGRRGQRDPLPGLQR